MASKRVTPVAHTIGIDTGKNTLHVIGLDEKGGARSILLHPASWAKHSFGPWLTATARRLHCNVLTVALANKLARIALTVLVQGRSYEARVRPTAA